MDSKQRRNFILTEIKQNTKPLSASLLAKKFQVSRQIIVGDVALLRAAGNQIIATPRGYILENAKESEGIIKTIAVIHTLDKLEDELYTIIDCGGSVIDVIVEHPLYGQLCGKLHLTSRFDVDEFINNVNTFKATPLSYLTNGLHLHTIQCKNEQVFHRIENALKEKGLLYEK